MPPINMEVAAPWSLSHYIPFVEWQSSARPRPFDLRPA